MDFKDSTGGKPQAESVRGEVVTSVTPFEEQNYLNTEGLVQGRGSPSERNRKGKKLVTGILSTTH